MSEHSFSPEQPQQTSISSPIGSLEQEQEISPFICQLSRITKAPEKFPESKYSTFSAVLESMDIAKNYAQVVINPF